MNTPFRDLIPPLSQEERAGLEASLLAEGCRDCLVVWDGHDILLDGHNRLDICETHGIPYNVVLVDLPDRDAAEDWIDANQLARRNLTPDQARILRGRRYNRTKKAHGGDRKSSRQTDDLNERTSASLAKNHGVSPRTIERDGALVAELEAKAPREIERVVRGEVKLADVKRGLRRQEIREHNESISVREAKAAEGVYDVVVIDPPWPMVKIERDVRENQADFDYPTMDESELRALPLPVATDCHVWCWTTHKFLPMALRLLDAWGLKYVCAFVWHKPGGFQPIGLPQYNCEFALYARNGSPGFLDTKAFPVCFDAPRGKHSEKPEAFYEIVRRVTAGRRLDMFNRRPIEGFDGWGKEAS